MVVCNGLNDLKHASRTVCRIDYVPPSHNRQCKRFTTARWWMLCASMRQYREQVCTPIRLMIVNTQQHCILRCNCKCVCNETKAPHIVTQSPHDPSECCCTDVTCTVYLI